MRWAGSLEHWIWVGRTADWLTFMRSDGMAIGEKPTLDRSRYAPASGLARGGYVLADCEGVPEVILMATGSEVQLAVAAYEELTEGGVRARVVSMPCWELFDQQPAEYRDEVLIPSVMARVAIEQASTVGWDRYVGTGGAIIGMRTFGASAPLKALVAEFGFTSDALVRAARDRIAAVATDQAAKG
jgi:transketolase